MRHTQLKRALILLCALLCLCGASEAAQRELSQTPPGQFSAVMEADSVSFDEATSTAVAEGHAHVTYQDMILYADRITMDSRENVIRAFALEGKRIRVERKAWNPLLNKMESQNLDGTYFEYHLSDATGRLESAHGTTDVEMGVLVVKGSSAEIAPAEIARERRWVHARNVRKSKTSDSLIRWNDASYTSCPQDEPHYRFVSKKAVLIPGRYIILHHPRVYAGETHLFTLPFNVTVNQGPRRNHALVILPNSDGDKGVGLEAKYRHTWRGGEFQIGGGLWEYHIKEYEYRIDQKLGSWISAYVGMNHHYDDDLEETKSRPFWGTTMAYAGWALDLGWAEREKRSVVKVLGEKEYETTLWRKPEAALTAPWISLHAGDFSQYFRFKGDWGKFQETGTRRSLGFIERYGWGIDYYTDYPFRTGAWTLSPFFKVDYWNYGYKNDSSDRQEITIGTIGIRASSGNFEFGTAFQQRRVSGRSGFAAGWDRFRDQDAVYQRIGVKVGPSLMLSVQGVFDTKARRADLLKEAAYILSYDNSCCTRWELTFHDDLTDRNNNDWFTLSIAVNAFPDAQFKLGSKRVGNPFGLPGGLKLKRKAGCAATMMEIDGTRQAEDGEIRLPVFDI